MEESYIGPVPWGENCAQAGQEDFQKKSRQECRAFINQIERYYPTPESGQLRIKRFSHDFGDYYEVVARGPLDWVCAVESDELKVLENWDAQARIELGIEIEHQ